jgi:YD repeat-containing protein
MATMCDVARMSMINDLRPGGQYAIYKDDNGNISLGFSPISIFNAGNISFKSVQGADVSIQNIPIYLPNKPPHSLIYYLGSTALAQELFNNWPDDLSEKLLPLHPEYCYLKFCDLPFVQAGNKFDTKLMNAETFADAQLAFGASNVSATNIDLFYSSDDFYATMAAPITSPNMQIQAIKDGIKNKFLDYTGQGHSIVKLALFMANCPSGNDINICPAVWGDAINADEEWQKFKSIYFTIKQEYLQRAREEFVLNATGCCPNNYIGCGTPNHGCPPHIWNNNFTHTIPTICNNNNNYEYASSIKRFNTINDIDFPGIPNPTTSLYDMKPSEMQTYLTSDSLKSPCPTCPELDAYKMMIWQMQEKKWIVQNETVQADAIIGLKDALRERMTGTKKNTKVAIKLLNETDFIITTEKCKLIFKADTSINWKKATIIPTCLEIEDYKNAKLHIMVDGVFKTILNISSDCDIFYCNGKAPEPPVVNNKCKCDSNYSSKNHYKLGDIVRYEEICFIVKRVLENGGVPSGYPPTNTKFWDMLCDAKIPNVCNDVKNVFFDGDQALNSQLTNVSSAIQPLTANKYTIRYNYTINGQNITSSPNPAVILYPTLNSQLLFQTTVATLQVNKNYTLSFEALLLSFGDQDCFNLIVEVNGQILVNENCIQDRIIPWITRNGWYNYSVSFNTGNTSTATLRFISGKQNVSDIIAIKNIRLSCEGATLNNGGTSTNQTSNSFSRYIPQSTCGCNSLCDPELPSPEMPMIPCDSILKDIATQQASTAYANYKDSVFNALLNGYYEKCMQSLETFSMDYTDAEYHYTLYYYDQSGNLVQTVPPAGVKPLPTTQLANVAAARNAINGPQILPAHFMKTNYNHNSLNAVVYQKTPDAGVSRFFYDKLGRIALSQNAKQWKPLLNTQLASYTYYDRQGRTVEVGEVRIIWQAFTSIKNRVSNYANWQTFISTLPRTEITKTFYDNPYLGILGKIDIAFGAKGQQNLRNRIGTVAYFANNTNLATDKYDHATHYNYDIAGNVTDLLQDFGTASDFGFDINNVRKQSKQIAYSFDLVSGKVNQVHYQKGYADQFLYKYAYNADNKLTAVFTSTNGLIWENDARYRYYRHGPLARTEFGTDGVQGTDYAYTLQGWIKGVNGKATMPSEDIGQDGTAANTTTIGYQAQNRNTAPDVFSYWLGYNKEDYKAIAGNTAYLGNAIQTLQTGAYHTTPAELFNGNIRSMYTNIQPFGGLGMHYQYDQLNRIKKQDGFNVFTNIPILNNAYSMALEYDPNGNIQKLLRNGTAATPAMDSLNYYYYNANGTTYRDDPTSPFATNKLAYVTDKAINTANYTEDIDGQLPYNYRYDAIGNLISDTKEGLNSIKWNLQNKITQINKANGITIGYKYDALGNRVFKKIQLAQGDYYSTYYVKDAQGNTLAIYEVKNNDTLAWTEQHLYGSARLGMYMPNKALLKLNIANNIQTTISTALIENNSYRNITQYELTNHLGNILATISDSKTNTNRATLLTATDYYAFGMAMLDRKYSLNSNEYRYGLNGQEKSNDIFKNSFSAEYWEYDSRIGRRWNVDPIDYPWLSPYQTFNNNPIALSDPDGLEASGGPIGKRRYHQKTGNSKFFSNFKMPNLAKIYGAISGFFRQLGGSRYGGLHIPQVKLSIGTVDLSSSVDVLPGKTSQTENIKDLINKDVPSDATQFPRKLIGIYGLISNADAYIDNSGNKINEGDIGGYVFVEGLGKNIGWHSMFMNSGFRGFKETRSNNDILDRGVVDIGSELVPGFNFIDDVFGNVFGVLKFIGIANKQGNPYFLNTTAIRVVNSSFTKHSIDYAFNIRYTYWRKIQALDNKKKGQELSSGRSKLFQILHDVTK